MSSEFAEDIAPWIAERAAARQAEWAARQAEKKRFRAECKAARDAGLRARQARKLARIKRSGSIA